MIQKGIILNVISIKVLPVTICWFHLIYEQIVYIKTDIYLQKIRLSKNLMASVTLTKLCSFAVLPWNQSVKMAEVWQRSLTCIAKNTNSVRSLFWQISVLLFMPVPVIYKRFRTEQNRHLIRLIYKFIVLTHIIIRVPFIKVRNAD